MADKPDFTLHGSQAKLPNGWHRGTNYERYMKDCVSELKKGNLVLAMCRDQLDELIELFGKNLVYMYNCDYSWWDCYLKNPKLEY